MQVWYEPAWRQHPAYLDMQKLLKGQPVMKDLDSYVESINTLVENGLQILQEIYGGVKAEISWDLDHNDGWTFVTGVFADGVNWLQSKDLNEPGDRDYSIMARSLPDEDSLVIELYGDQNTAFEGLLARAAGESEAILLRSLHLKLRREYRNSNDLKDLVNLMNRLEVQRDDLLNTLSQFERLSG
jgi:hypothetical protein